MGFVWDTLKAAANLQKHAVSFKEAQSVFRDPLAVTVEDTLHSAQSRAKLSSVARITTGCCSSASRNMLRTCALSAHVKPHARRERNMKTTPRSETPPLETPQVSPVPDDMVDALMADDMLPEYDIDYSKARPNRFAARLAQTRTVELEPDVAAVFTTQVAVNDALRALIQAMPQAAQHKTP